MKLTFNLDVARQKPDNSGECPFCRQQVLGKELGRDGSILWVENLYPTMADCYQTVVIESDWHEGDIPDYEPSHNRKLFAFLYKGFRQLQATGRFASVLLYRNFGPLSGGSLRHPHSQIIGLTELDGYAKIKPSYFEGLVVQAKANGRAGITLSTDPIMGYCEFNISISHPAELDNLADACQQVLRYLKTDYFPTHDLSYNLFFFEQGEGLVVKVLPRLVASPYFLAYGIRMVDNDQRLEEVKQGLLTYLT